MNLISSYTSEDRDTIQAAYTNVDEVAAAIESHDESHASVEDLLSYYVEQTGHLPDFMTGALLTPDDPELKALWGDAEFVEAVQDWRRTTIADTSQSTLQQQLVEFLNAGEQAGFAANDINKVLDAEDFLKDWNNQQNQSTVIPDNDPKGAMLEINMANLLMKIGNPGLALLLFVTGSQTTETVPTDPEALPDYMTLNEDGKTVTIITSTGPVTANLGETVTFTTIGFGSTVQESQEDVLDHMGDLQMDVEDLSYDLQDLDPTDPMDQNEAERIKQDIQSTRNLIEIDRNVMETYQNMIDSLLDAASAMTDRQFRTVGSITNRI